jgi:AbrB family looped-hinge helix DNA binding protein
VTYKLTLDKAGRVVLPKPLRDELQLAPGDSLEVEGNGDHMTLRPLRPQVPLRKEHGIWVYHGERSSLALPDLIAREREKRLAELPGCANSSTPRS